MVIEILTVVMLILWLASVIPTSPSYLASNFLAWMTVALVVMKIYGVHVLGQ